MESRESFEDNIDIQKYWIALKRRWLLAVGVFGFITSLSIFFLSTQKPVYEAEGKVLIRTSHTSTLTGLGEGIGQLEALGMQASPLDTQAEIVQSTPVLEETIKALNLRNSQGELLQPADLLENLGVQGIRGTDVLQITYESTDPKSSTVIVNKIIEVYIKNNIQANRAEAISARQFIAEQLPETETAVREADLALRRFKEENQVIVLQDEAVAAVKAISDLENQIAQAQAQLVDVTVQSQALQSQIGLRTQDAVTLTALSQSPGVQDVLTQLQSAQQQLAIEQTRYQPGYPTIVNLERKIDALSTLLQTRIEQTVGNSQPLPEGNLQIGILQQNLTKDLITAEAQRLGLTQRITALSNAQIAYRERASSLPRLAQTQQELERRLKAAQTTYEALLTRLQEVQVAENQNIGNARIISPASVPGNPVSPKKMFILGAGGFVGFLLAIATVFSLDLIDHSVKTVKEAKDLFRYTLLGVIPTSTKSARNQSIIGTEQLVPKVLTQDELRSPEGQSYQMLQANLRFLSSDKKLKSIVITSSVAKEGKSEVSANLATSMAQMGRRVLLIDADMYRPIQHHIWHLTNAVGLSNVMVHQVEFTVAVQEVAPNLHVLPSGAIPPNPIALLDSKRMLSLVDTLSHEYDFIIFDTPPLAGLADAAVLGKMVDGILLVVRPGVVDSASANAAKEFLTQSNQVILGMVVNGVDIKHEPDSYFYHNAKSAGSNLELENFTLTERFLSEGFKEKETEHL